MYEVTTSTDLDIKAKEIKQRIEALRINNPKLYAQLNPILSELVLFLDSAAAHLLRQYNQIKKLEMESSESNRRSQMRSNQWAGGLSDLSL